MKRFVLMLLVTALTLFSGYAFADTDAKAVNDQLNAKIATMTDSQKRDALAQINGDASALEKAGTIGVQIGKGLAEAAKELGVAGNEFANSPVGHLVVGILIWKFVGNSIIHYLFALLAVWWISNFWKRSLAHVDEKTGKYVYDWDKISGDLTIGMFVMTGGVALAIGILIGTA